jgi:D-alanyl-D-alanine carboxypeptidase
MQSKALDHSLEFINSWLTFRYERAEIPGYVVAVAHKGNVIFNEAYGYADLASQTELTPQHIFRIASHSKTFTATALMQLQEQGKLRIDDYAVQYLPWLEDHKDIRWRKVTIRQLMSHSAGVVRDGLKSDYWQLERPFPDHEEFQKELLESELVLDTNTNLKYSNFGYTLLGLLIEAVSNETYNEYVTNHIVTELGLKHTGPEYTAAIQGKVATGYTRRDVNKTRLPIAHADTHAMSAATGFYSTAEDMCNYFSAHMVGSGKLLDDESKKEMQRTQWHAKLSNKDAHLDYGLGLNIEYIGEHRFFGHGGGFPGHITRSIADAKDELVVIVLTNCIDGGARQIAEGIVDALDYFQKNTSTSKPMHDMGRIEGRYMNLWAMTDIVVTSDKVVATYPDTWSVLTHPEELAYVDDTTLKITNTDSFSAEGELVRFNFKDDVVESVNYNGSTMWPEKIWLQRQAKRTIVE